MSLIEAATNVIVRYALAVGMQIAVFPVFGIHVALADQLAIGLAFTGLSLVRGATSGRLTTSTKTPNVSNAGQRVHSLRMRRWLLQVWRTDRTLQQVAPVSPYSFGRHQLRWLSRQVADLHHG